MIQLIAYPQGTNFNAGGYIDSTILDLYDTLVKSSAFNTRGIG